MNFLFGGSAPKKVDPVEEAKKWKQNLAREMRHLERDKCELDRAEKKAAVECKRLAKMGQLSSAKILAKEIVNIRKAAGRLLTAKAQMNSVSMALQSSVSLLKLQGVMSKSTEVMSMMNQLIKLPEVSATMSAMAREMERAGLVEEMISDTFAAIEPDDLEIEADAEVLKVIEELTSDLLAPAGLAPTTRIKMPAPVGKGNSLGEAVVAATEMDHSDAANAELLALQARLGAL